jgi:hypothetical protein
VRKGSGGIGGKRFQVLAMALTYASITFTNVPYVVRGLADAEAGSATDATPPPDDTAQAAGLPPGRSNTPMAPATATPPDAQPAVAVPAEEISLPMRLLGVVLILAVAMAAPFLAGFENIIGWIIIGIGLYEAWKFTRETVPAVTGPFPVSAQAARREERAAESAPADVA